MLINDNRAMIPPPPSPRPAQFKSKVVIHRDTQRQGCEVGYRSCWCQPWKTRVELLNRLYHDHGPISIVHEGYGQKNTEPYDRCCVGITHTTHAHNFPSPLGLLHLIQYDKQPLCYLYLFGGKTRLKDDARTETFTLAATLAGRSVMLYGAPIFKES